MGIISKWKWWVFVCDELTESIWSCDKLGWDWMETIWSHTFIIELCIVVEEHPGFNEYSLTPNTKKRDYEMNHVWIICCFWIDWFNEMNKNRDCHCHWWWCLSNCVYKMTNMFFLTLFHILIVGRNDLDELVIKLMNKHGYSINNDDEGSVMMDLIIIQRWRRNMKYQMNKPPSLRMNDMIVQSVFSEIACLELMGLIN